MLLLELLLLIICKHFHVFNHLQQIKFPFGIIYHYLAKQQLISNILNLNTLFQVF